MIRRPVGILTATVVVLAAGAAGVWWFSPYGEVAEVGQVIDLNADVGPDRFDLDLAREVVIRVPGGSVVVRVGERVDDLPHGSRTADIGELDDGDLHAPRGADFLPLQWQVVPSAVTTVSGVYEFPDPVSLLSLTVRSGELGEMTTRISDDTFQKVAGSAGDASGVALVLEEEDPDSATVEVTFDGETQTIGLADGDLDPGLAAPLYALQETGQFSIPAPAPLTGRLPRGFGVEETASVTNVQYLPWLPGRGWVEEPGTAWCSIAVQTVIDPTPDRQPDSRFGYRLRLDGHTETLDGAPQLDVVQPEVQDGTGSGNIAVTGTMVWLVDEPPRELELRYELSLLARGGARPVEQFALGATIDVADAALGAN